MIIDNCIWFTVLKYSHGSFGWYYQTQLYEADVIKVFTLTGMKIETAKVASL